MFQVVCVYVRGEQNGIDYVDFVQNYMLFSSFYNTTDKALSNIIVNLRYIRGWYYGE